MVKLGSGVTPASGSPAATLGGQATTAGEEPPDNRSWWRKAGSAVKDTASDVWGSTAVQETLRIAQVPAAAISSGVAEGLEGVGFLEGDASFGDYGNQIYGTGGKAQSSFFDTAIRKAQEDGNVDKSDKFWLGVGLGLDLVADPLNFLGGAGIATKAGKAGKAAKAAEAVGDAGRTYYRTNVGRDAFARTLESAAKTHGIDTARGQQAFRMATEVRANGLGASIRKFGPDAFKAEGIDPGLHFGVGNKKVKVPGTERFSTALPYARGASSKMADTALGRKMASNLAGRAGQRNMMARQFLKEGLDSSENVVSAAARVAAHTDGLRNVRAAETKVYNNLAKPLNDKWKEAAKKATGGKSATVALQTLNDAIRRDSAGFIDAIESGANNWNGVDLTPITDALFEAGEELRWRGILEGDQFVENYFPRFVEEARAVREFSDSGASFLKARHFREGTTFLGEKLRDGSRQEVLGRLADEGLDADFSWLDDPVETVDRYLRRVSRLVAMHDETYELAVKQGYGFDVKDIEEAGKVWVRSDGDEPMAFRAWIAASDVAGRPLDAEDMFSVAQLDSIVPTRILTDPVGFSDFARRRAFRSESRVAENLWSQASQIARVARDPLTVEGRGDLIAAYSASLEATLYDLVPEALAKVDEAPEKVEAMLRHIAATPKLEKLMYRMMDQGNVFVAPAAGDMLVPDFVADAIGFRGKFTSNGLAQWVAKANSLLRSQAVLSPGFSTRNYMGGVFSEYASGHSIRSMKRGIRALDDATKGNWGAIPEDLRDYARTIVRNGDFTGGDVTDALSGGGSGLINQAIRNTGRALDERIGQGIGTVIGGRRVGSLAPEEQLRFSHLLEEMRLNGGDYEAARDSMFKYHFDYKDLTTAERYLREGSLFYTFWARNLPLMIELIGRRPGLMNQFVAWEEAANMAWADTEPPEWMDGGGFVPLPMKVEQGQVFFRDDTQWRQLTDVWEAPGRYVLSALSPIFRVPSEVALNKKYFSGNAIEAPYNRADSLPGITVDPDVAAKLLPLMPVEWVAFDAETGEVAVDPRVMYVLEAASPMLGRVDGLYAGSSESEAYDRERALAAWLTFAGVPATVGGDGETRSERKEREQAELEKLLEVLGWTDSSGVRSGAGLIDNGPLAGGGSGSPTSTAPSGSPASLFGN